jgi:two-component system response regulator
MNAGNSSGPILLVEDKVDDERLTLRALSSCGLNHEVFVVRDGGEALDYLFGLGRFKGRDVRQQPVLVLLDLALPTVDGFEVMRQIRAEPVTRHVPVVMLTGNREQSALLESYGAGANGYVVKPTDLSTYAQTVREIGGYWVRVNETARAV